MAENKENALIILGVKHSGKSTLGAYLSEILELPFFDLDRIIEENVKMSVRQYYATKGEDAFKKAEYEACKSTFEQNHGAFVLATGGGICDNEKALSVLNGKKILLDASEETCFARVKQNALTTGSYPAYIQKQNPADENEARSIFHEFYQRRRQNYLKLADKVVEWA